MYENKWIRTLSKAVLLFALPIAIAFSNGCSSSIDSPHKYSKFEAVIAELKSVATKRSSDLIKIAVEDKSTTQALQDPNGERVVVLSKSESAQADLKGTETTFTLLFAMVDGHWVCTSAKSAMVRDAANRSESSIYGKGIEVEDLINWMRL